MQNTDKFDPTPFDPDAFVADQRAKDPAFKLAYDALEDEYAALAALLHARTHAGLTQAEVAKRMGVSQPVVARIESSLGKKNHSPSLHTLRRYAEACGMKLIIQMVQPT